MRLPTALLLLQLSASAGVESTIVLGNGIRLEFSTSSGNNTPDPLKAEVKPANANSAYRIFHDESGLTVYAYELVAERLADGNHFQLVAKPADEAFAAKFPYADGGKPTPTMAVAVESPPLPPGGRLTIDIPTNPGLFEHRTDTVTVQPDMRESGNGQAESRSVPALRFADLVVTIGGKAVGARVPGRDVSGEYVMFYIPGRGGFFFSAQPVASRPFVPATIVDGTRLKFSIDKEDFECFSGAPILMRSAANQIWVYHNPRYTPAPDQGKDKSKSHDEFFTAASNSLTGWLR